MPPDDDKAMELFAYKPLDPKACDGPLSIRGGAADDDTKKLLFKLFLKLAILS